MIDFSIAEALLCFWSVIYQKLYWGPMLSLDLSIMNTKGRFWVGLTDLSPNGVAG